MARPKLKVQVIISGYVAQLIDRLHEEYPNTEWSWIARIEKREWHYLVTDIRFPKQSNSWGNTEIKDGGLESLLEDIFTNNPEQLPERKVRIHSHHSMWVFRSGTDATAKASFNDWNMDYRWSIVTAYKGNTITYKCALNVFKPANIEFDVPVKAEDFNYEDYLSKIIPDYVTYKKAFDQLTAQRDAAMEEYNQPYVPTEADVSTLIDIFNVEDNEDNRASCLDIFEKNTKGQKKAGAHRITEEYDDACEELLEFFGWDIFADKLIELADSIEATKTYVFGSWQYGKQIEGEVRQYDSDGYPNPLPGQKSLFDPEAKPDIPGSRILNHYWYPNDRD